MALATATNLAMRRPMRAIVAFAGRLWERSTKNQRDLECPRIQERIRKANRPCFVGFYYWKNRSELQI